MPLESPLPPEQDWLAAQAHFERLTSEFAARCAAIDSQLRERLTDNVELKYLSGIRASSAKVDDGMSHATLAQTIGDIPVQIMPEATFTAL